MAKLKATQQGDRQSSRPAAPQNAVPKLAALRPSVPPPAVPPPRRRLWLLILSGTLLLLWIAFLAFMAWQRPAK